MNKSQFVELVQKAGGYTTKKEAENAINAFTQSISDALAIKESVALVGFGTFTPLDVPEKSGKVPGTDKTYTKPAHTGLKFKAGQTLKDKVNILKSIKMNHSHSPESLMRQRKSSENLHE